MIGAHITPTGTPAFAIVSITLSRRSGDGAHGSIARASSASVNARLTLTCEPASLASASEQIDVALDERALRDDARPGCGTRGTPRGTRRVSSSSRLDRLVAVGHAGEHHQLALPARLVERLAQQLRRARLDDDLGVEVGPRAEIEILVRRPRVAIGARVHGIRGTDSTLQRKPRSGESLCAEDRARVILEQGDLRGGGPSPGSYSTRWCEAIRRVGRRPGTHETCVQPYYAICSVRQETWPVRR